MDLIYDSGTILVANPNSSINLKNLGAIWDERTSQWRTPAFHYKELVLQCHNRSLQYQDKVRSYQNIGLEFQNPIIPRPHQKEALEAWIKAERRGTVCLPTGAGKTVLAMLAISNCKRPALIVVPTIELLHQWHDVIKKTFDYDAGILGGGSHEIKEITVSTYDSASLHFEKLGNKFGLLVFDECHHLPAPRNMRIAEGSIAPFRLGLSATVERADAGEKEIYRLVGPLVYEAEVQGVIGQGLSPYDVITIKVDMTEKEIEQYREQRAIYTSFVKAQHINFSQPNGWMQFVAISSRTPGGRAAMQAFRKQKKMAQAAGGKLVALWRILTQHVGERVIVFTDDNEFAYQIGSKYFLPVLTHRTKTAERKKMLESFRNGKLSVLVTSKVLNEGVDVPEASIGVVMSGSGTVREHVQRLGRVLRYKEGKRATLYEIVTKGTGEGAINQRRRQHHAYQKSH
jgi:superfamily II DNA or RNA helicase